MENLKNIKIVTDDNKEYVVMNYIEKENGVYALITNLNDDSDTKFVKLDLGKEKVSFSTINDDDIIAEIVADLL